MAKYEFSQSEMLNLLGAVPVEAQGGVCAGVCDHWLSLITSQPDQAPEQRMAALLSNARGIVQHYIQYEVFKQSHGREQAKKHFGSIVGLEYDTDKTVVEQGCIGMTGIVDRMCADIGFIGAAANWTIVFQRGRHAVAGFCSFKDKASNVHEMVLHLFDPNFGERVCSIAEVRGQMFTMLAPYPGISKVHRIDVKF